MEIKKGVILVLVAYFLLVAMLSFAMAEKSDNETRSDVAKVEKNMTYGQCVSAGAKIKNDCYSSVKSAYSSCKTNATNTTVCKSNYKKDMKQCKADFKSTKNECKKIKHNFLETARYAFV